MKPNLPLLCSILPNDHLTGLDQAAAPEDPPHVRCTRHLTGMRLQAMELSVKSVHDPCERLHGESCSDLTALDQVSHVVDGEGCEGRRGRGAVYHRKTLLVARGPSVYSGLPEGKGRTLHTPIELAPSLPHHCQSQMGQGNQVAACADGPDLRVVTVPGRWRDQPGRLLRELVRFLRIPESGRAVPAREQHDQQQRDTDRR